MRELIDFLEECVNGRTLHTQELTYELDKTEKNQHAS